MIIISLINEKMKLFPFCLQTSDAVDQAELKRIYYEVHDLYLLFLINLIAKTANNRQVNLCGLG